MSVDWQYPLKNSSILNSGTTIHVFNQITRFINFRTAPDGEFVWAGDSKVPILGYGEVDIQVRGAKRKLQVLRLYDVAFCEGFAANLVSFQQLRRQGYWWDTRPHYNCLRRGNDSVVAYLREIHCWNISLTITPIPRWLSTSGGINSTLGLSDAQSLETQ
jgi:hypothetical protein